jgi:GNAT superfamily N-acetyltransferase
MDEGKTMRPGEPSPNRETQQISGLTFREMRGKADYEMMAEVANASWAADKVVYLVNAEDISFDYAPAPNFDPSRDCMLAEVDGRLIGFCSVVCHRNLKNQRLFVHSAHLLPEWRSTDIRRVMLRMNEGRGMEIARSQSDDSITFLETWANVSDENHWRTILEQEGYEHYRSILEMERRDLGNIPEFSLPTGVEVKEVRPDQYATVWHAMNEAMKEDSSYTEGQWSDENMERYIKTPIWTPRLWQIAWKGDEVVGGVFVFIDKEENERFSRMRGYTEMIFVTRPWRHKGVAHALIARGLRALKGEGMEQAALDVHTDNPSDALKLYGSLGYESVKQFGYYRKNLEV